MSPTNAREVAAKAAQGFPLLQCQECADAIRAALLAAGHGGQVIEIRAVGRLLFMVCSSYMSGNVSITENGRHLGVRVGDDVFDNLHPEGLRYGLWLAEFDAPDGIESFSTTDF